MIVVPAFAEGDHGKNEIVLAVVSRLVALRSVHVGEGIDRTGAVEQSDGGDEEAPDQHLRTIRAESWCIGFQQLPQSEHAESADGGH